MRAASRCRQVDSHRPAPTSASARLKGGFALLAAVHDPAHPARGFPARFLSALAGAAVSHPGRSLAVASATASRSARQNLADGGRARQATPALHPLVEATDADQEMFPGSMNSRPACGGLHRRRPPCQACIAPIESSVIATSPDAARSVRITGAAATRLAPD